ncbi:MAG: hypothetical protein AB7O04_12270, partial [Hyphomonadaceae bacterium]
RRPLPYMAQFRFNGRRLLYVAARHDVARSSPTFRLIDRAFRMRPDALIVEGIPSAWGVNPTQITGRLRAMAEGDEPGSYLRGEPGYAMQWALARGVPFMGGEPANPEIDSMLLRQGYAAADIAGVKMLQWLPQGLIAGEFTDNHDPRFRAFLDRTAQSIAADFNGGLVFSRAIFEAWHARQFGASIYEDDDYAGRLDPAGATRAAEISRAMTLIRDRHIFACIAAAAEAHERVLVVYGGAHFATQWRALAAAFGPPRLL